MTNANIKDCMTMFNEIVSIVKIDKNYVKRNYQSLGGMWTTDKWQFGNTLVFLEDEGYTMRVHNLTFDTNIIAVPKDFNLPEMILKVISGSLDHLEHILEEVKRKSIESYVVVCDVASPNKNSIAKVTSGLSSHKTLGDKLRDSIIKEEGERAEIKRQELIYKNNMKMKKIESFNKFIEQIKSSIVDKIEKGYDLPFVKVDSSQEIDWIKSVNCNYKKSDEDYIYNFKVIWHEMFDYFLSEDIIISVKEEYSYNADNSSWLIIMANPRK